MRLASVWLSVLAVAVGSSCQFAAPVAEASPRQLTYLDASAQLLNPHSRRHAARQLVHLGVKGIRLELSWAGVAPAPNSAHTPRVDLAAASSYGWGDYDAVLELAHRHRWSVLLTVTAPAPRWATANRRAPYVTRPDDRDFRAFMKAVGEHFGSRVGVFGIWNEPNHPAFLMPQWNADGTPASPGIYRGLYRAAEAGLREAGMQQPRLLLGETAPVGYTAVSPGGEGARAMLHAVAPLAFLRGALCLDARYRRTPSCGALQAVGYGHHAYAKAGDPHYIPPGSDNVTLGALDRLSSALDRAAAAGALKKRLPIFITEFGVQSYPNRRLGVPVATQAIYDAIAEHLAWANGRVAAFSQYLLRDDPLGGAPGSSASGGFVGFQTGLEYANGAAKPLYAAWPLPLTVTATGHGVSLWGLVRPASGATRATVLVRPPGARGFAVWRVLGTDSLGYWHATAPILGATWRVRWRSPDGQRYEGAVVPE